MQIISKSFTGQADLRAMERLAREYRDLNLHVNDLPYRFGTPALQDPENIGLLVDGSGELLAWMVMQTTFGSLDFCCQPDLQATLLPQLLEWADRRSHAYPGLVPLGTPEGLPCWFINIFANLDSTIEIIERVGFICQADVGEYSWSKVWMKRPGNLVVKDYRIPPGFLLRPLAGRDEVEAYVQVHRETFGTKIMNSEWRQRTLIHPGYASDLDMVVAAPDGRLAAFCVGWLDHSGGEAIGQIEPLGCHPDYRHLALGRVVLAEVLHRFQTLHATRVYVETDNWRNTAFRLYESLGFQVEKDVLVYRKDYQAHMIPC